jgi:glycosyltransferase involved in cell wall biosynthesis
MKTCGFTFVRNAIKYDYPVLESIKSILPICDEFVVAVGNSDDNTLELIQSIESPKIRIIETVWNDSLRKGGQVLAVETDKALDIIGDDFDWCFYIQADEVVHEKYLDTIREAMEKYKDNIQVEGLLFKYLHFYGNYQYVGNTRQWYRNEIRIIRNNKQIRSYRDAQGFRKNDEKLWVKPIDAYIYHYGWVKDPYKQNEKLRSSTQLYHENINIDEMIRQGQLFDYSQINSLDLFKGTQPELMKDRIARQDWDFKFDINKKSFNLKDGTLHWIEKHFGVRLFEYRNYRIIK